MQRIDKKSLKDKFDKSIYSVKEPVFITSEEFWDGGIYPKFPLQEKAKFYTLSAKMSKMLKEFLEILDEDIFVADFLCEYEKMYADWRGLKKKEPFRIVSKMFKKKRCYQLSLPEDSEKIDLMIESNFLYYTHFTLYLPKSGIMIQPTCHTELILYSENSEYMKQILEKIAESYDDITIQD